MSVGRESSRRTNPLLDIETNTFPGRESDFSDVRLRVLRRQAPETIEHVHPEFCWVVLRLHGTSEVQVLRHGQERAGIARPGHIFIERGGTGTKWIWSHPMETICIGIPLSIFQAVMDHTCGGQMNDIKPTEFSFDPTLASIMQDLRIELAAGGAHAPLLTRCLTLQLTVRCLRRYTIGSESSASKRNGKNFWDTPVLEFIEQNLSNSLTLESLAGHSGLSVFHFSRTFRNHVGQSPHAYIVQRRIELAKRMLEYTGHSIMRVCTDAGFPNPSHFATTFRRHIGETPAAFRERRQAQGVDGTAKMLI